MKTEITTEQANKIISGLNKEFLTWSDKAGNFVETEGFFEDGEAQIFKVTYAHDGSDLDKDYESRFGKPVFLKAVFLSGEFFGEELDSCFSVEVV